jgi:hypothetical protein
MQPRGGVIHFSLGLEVERTLPNDVFWVDSFLLAPQCETGIGKRLHYFSVNPSRFGIRGTSDEIEDVFGRGRSETLSFGFVKQGDVFVSMLNQNVNESSSFRVG